MPLNRGSAPVRWCGEKKAQNLEKWLVVFRDTKNLYFIIGSAPVLSACCHGVMSVLTNVYSNFMSLGIFTTTQYWFFFILVTILCSNRTCPILWRRYQVGMRMNAVGEVEREDTSVPLNYCMLTLIHCIEPIFCVAVPTPMRLRCCRGEGHCCSKKNLSYRRNIIQWMPGPQKE